MKIIEILKYVLIGIIQGIAEVLPISSSAHLLIAGWLLDINVDISLEIILHFASLLGVIVFMRKKLLKLVKGTFIYIFKKDHNEKKQFLYLINLSLSTIILVIFTLLLNDYIEAVFNKLYIVGILLIINGIILFVFTNFKGTKNNLKIKDSIIIGIFESIGVFPGISRSGITLAGCNICKINKEEASDYAFLLFIPATLGAFVYNLKSFNVNIIINNITGYILSFITTFIITYISFVLLLKVIRKKQISVFGYYCIIAGLIVYLLNF